MSVIRAFGATSSVLRPLEGAIGSQTPKAKGSIRMWKSCNYLYEGFNYALTTGIMYSGDSRTLPKLRPLTFALVIGLFDVTRSLPSYPRPCMDLEPASLLDHVAPSFYAIPHEIEVTYDAAHSTHAYRFSNRASRVHFMASKLLKLCNYFPEEFSLLITLKLANITGEQCIMTLMPRVSNEVKVGVTLMPNVVRVTYASQKVIRVDFDDMDVVFDGQWHSVVVSVTGEMVSVRVDCRHAVSRRLKRRFPAFIDAGDDEIHIGNCNQETGLFTGWLKDIILLSGSDISLMSCPQRASLHSSHGNDVNVIQDFSEVQCGWQDTGRMTFDLYQNSIQVCMSGVWEPYRMKEQNEQPLHKKRMDFITWHQDIITAAPLVDMELFRIPGEGLFMATASYDRLLPNKQQSAIFRWHQGRFKVFQSLYSLGAQAWEYFAIGKKFFLAVANLGARRDRPSKSTVYRWSRKRKKFRLFQELTTCNARDIEHLEVNGQHYLAVANHVQGNNYSIDSTLFIWDPISRVFKASETLGSHGAMDFTHFRVEQYDFLVVANSFIGEPQSSSRVNSVVHLWQNKRFLPFQNLMTIGATDFEAFAMNGDYFLAVANAYDFGHNASNVVSERYHVKSTIYRLNKILKQFEVYQEIDTQSILDWEHFQVGDDHYLIASNSRRGLGPSSSSPSVIYRWQGVERFVPKHQLDSLPAADWEVFVEDGETFMVYANSENNISQVLKVKLI